MEHARHECEENENQEAHKVYFDPTEDGGAWLFRSRYFLDVSLKVKHCPYCGLKLEPPDVKIEVSRKVLGELAWAVESICTGPVITKRAMAKLRELTDAIYWDKIHD